MTPWTLARQAPLSMGCSRQEYWRGVPWPPPRDPPNPGIEPASLTSPALAGGLFTTSATWEAPALADRLPLVPSLFQKCSWILEQNPRKSACLAQLCSVSFPGIYSSVYLSNMAVPKTFLDNTCSSPRVLFRAQGWYGAIFCTCEAMPVVNPVQCFLIC